MDFWLTAEQLALVETIRAYLEKTHTSDLLRTLDSTASARSPRISRGLIETGLPALLVPEQQGGMGASCVEAVMVALELGRAGVTDGLVDTALVAAPLLAKNPSEAELLCGIAAGQVRISLQHEVNPWVADMDEATYILMGDGERLLLSSSAKSEFLPSIDPLRRLRRPIRPVGRPICGTADDLLNFAALMTAAQALGCAERMLAFSVEYAKNRTQFGQPIGSFQAIKHRLANDAVRIAFARPVLLRSAWLLSKGGAHVAAHVSHAKLAASDAACAMAETAIQVHGAMGYTYEVDLHYWMKRAWALSGAWGARLFHLQRIERDLLGGVLPLGPAATFE